MHVGAIYYWQDFDLICSHALQRDVQTLIGVHVRKGQRVDQIYELLIRALLKLLFQLRTANDSNHASLIRHQPASKFARSNLFESFAYRCVSRKRNTRSLHDFCDLPLTALTGVGVWEVDAVLHS